VGLNYAGNYGEVFSALYRTSPGASPIKVAVKKTKVSTLSEWEHVIASKLL